MRARERESEGERDRETEKATKERERECERDRVTNREREMVRPIGIVGRDWQRRGRPGPKKGYADGMSVGLRDA